MNAGIIFMIMGILLVVLFVLIMYSALHCSLEFDDLEDDEEQMKALKKLKHKKK